MNGTRITTLVFFDTKPLFDNHNDNIQKASMKEVHYSYKIAK